MATGGAATWMTGSYDKESDTVDWGVGNPIPRPMGRAGWATILHANSMIALDAKTGKLRWHYQFTPHDVHDWDATAPLLLVDEVYRGKPRKLVMQANRNGFFYVLDRTNGQFLFAKQFVDKMNWASGIDAKGRPILIPGREPTEAGVFACPAVRGATNWFSTAYNPETEAVLPDGGRGLRRVPQQGADLRRQCRCEEPGPALPACDRPADRQDRAGETADRIARGQLFGRSAPPRAASSFTARRRAASLRSTGRRARRSGYLPTNDAWRASPMTYMVGGHQYVAVAAGSSIISVTLPEGAPQ